MQRIDTLRLAVALTGTLLGLPAPASELPSAEQLQACATEPDAVKALACFQELSKKAQPLPPDHPDEPPIAPAPVSRLVVQGELEPAYYRSTDDVFDDPATISLSRTNNSNAVDAAGAVVYEHRIGTFENHVVFGGVGWFRSELGEKRSDVRAVAVGGRFVQGLPSEWFAIWTPAVRYSRDILKKTTTDTYGVEVTLSNYDTLGGFLDDAVLDYTVGLTSSQQRPDNLPNRDSLTGTFGFDFGMSLTEQLVFNASPRFYSFIDRPGQVDEGSAWYGDLSLRWEFDPETTRRFRPYLLLSRTFGTSPDDPEWIPNQTVLSIGVRFDDSFVP